jgi:uncharacterized protein (TIGR03067 family)
MGSRNLFCANSDWLRDKDLAAIRPLVAFFQPIFLEEIPMRFCFGLIVVLSTLLGANAAQDEAAKKDLDSLQGVWQCVSMEIDGKSMPADQVKALKLTFKGNKASHPGADDKVEEAIVKLDPTKKPKAIDFSPLAGSDNGAAIQAIYSLEKDTLKICGASKDTTRPTEFKAGKGVTLVVLTREKK